MTQLPAPEEFLAIQQVVNDLWAGTDRIVDAPAEALIADDGRMAIGTLEAEGRAEIGRYNSDRRATEEVSGRRVRHLCTNLLVVNYESNAITIRCAMLVFQGVGEMPFASSLPSNIADSIISLSRQDDGRWLIAELLGSPIFVGPGAPSNAR